MVIENGVHSLGIILARKSQKDALGFLLEQEGLQSLVRLSDPNPIRAVFTRDAGLKSIVAINDDDLMGPFIERMDGASEGQGKLIKSAHPVRHTAEAKGFGVNEMLDCL